jgi:hypothetical protein
MRGCLRVDGDKLGGLPDCWDGVVLSARQIYEVLVKVESTGEITDEQKYIVQNELDCMSYFTREGAFDEYWTPLSQEKMDLYAEKENEELMKPEPVR